MEYEHALSDGVVTVSELESLPSLVLSDGRSFQFHRTTQGPDAITAYRIDFE